MDKRVIRLTGWVAVWVIGCALWWLVGDVPVSAESEQWTVPTIAPILTNPGFECEVGYTPIKNPDLRDNLAPIGWSVLYLKGSPDVSSTRVFYTGECNPNSSRLIEKLRGNDSLLVRSQDIESAPEPGKPFDVVIYHKIPATYGGAYSLSAWMTSKCGNQNPVDCPEGYYIAKAVGIDANGGSDPNSPSIEWVEDRDNLRWQNLFTSATALTSTITVFARMTSPFQFHGNLGFMDEFSIIRAPLSALQRLPATVNERGRLTLRWIGQQSEDVTAIVAGNYDLLFDVQARPLPSGEWRDIVYGAIDQFSTEFVAPCLNKRYSFRVRARAEQPEDEEGASPNHRYMGVWSKPQNVLFTTPPTEPISETLELSPTLYIPIAANMTEDGC